MVDESQPVLALDATIRDAIRAIEATPKRLAVVLDPERRVRGTLTDGDVRRALLAGTSLEAPVTEAMNDSPLTVTVGTPEDALRQLLDQRNLEALPLVDAEGRCVGVIHVSDIDPDVVPPGSAAGFSCAVIMAGGEGRRLGALTRTQPKPMLDVGGMPLIERIVRSLVRVGVGRIFISTHYLGHVIEDHFGSGSSLGADIRYLREKEKLGTAGALTLLPEPPAGPILVMNGDVLTGSDYGNILLFHRRHEALMTVAAVEYNVDIPYGVIRTDDYLATGLEEKPSQRFLCNAGIYVLSPGALACIPRGCSFNMTDLIERAIATGARVATFPLHEYWTDIGNPADLARAREDLDPGRDDR